MPPRKWKRPSIKTCEDAVGDLAPRWAGRCYEISVALVEKLEIPGRAQYGMYYGPIASTSIFYGKPFARHGWVELDDGRIFDPTRWAFTTPKRPALWLGEDKRSEYDLGAQRLHAKMGRPRKQPPPYDPTQRQITLVVDPPVRDFLAIQLGEFVSRRESITLSLGQLFWLANCPLRELREGEVDRAPDIYKAIVAAGEVAVIPLDLRLEVLPDYRRADD